MNIRIIILVIIGLIIIIFNAYGQYKTGQAETNKEFVLTGNLICDLRADNYYDAAADSAVSAKKTVKVKLYSPVTAGLFSLVIPGAGQLYTKQYLKGSLFLGAEAVLWAVYLLHEKKGDDKTSDFKKYADENWSVVRYAGWINANFSKNIAINQTEVNLQPWERVQWDELNTIEEEIGGDLSIQPTGFTHKLAPYSDQQYYEMIGKYSQFGSGWADAGWFTRADVIANSGLGNVSDQFKAYAKMRGDANDYYDIATTATYIIVANHILSALEAVWNTSGINRRIRMHSHIEPRNVYGNFVEFVPTLHMQCEL
ncbi:MAG: hypothetical protein JXA06_02460 [Bacteroidetes bacterium]|nr:hypothetical protein [Bacteroidota bacterium]